MQLTDITDNRISNYLFLPFDISDIGGGDIGYIYSNWADVHSYWVGSIVWSLYMTGCDVVVARLFPCMLLRIGGTKK